MQQLGGSKALKNTFDSLFLKPSKIEKEGEQYKKCLVNCTADGANMNWNSLGVLTQLNRPWLPTIHWADHRIELDVISAFDIPAF